MAAVIARKAQSVTRLSELPDLVTQKQMAKYFGVTILTILIWRRKGIFKYVQPSPRTIRVPRSEIERLVREGFKAV